MDTVLPFVTASALRDLSGTFRAPLIVDVRKPAAFASDPRVIVGAIRRAHDAVASWAPDLPAGQPIVAYCVLGHEVSQGVVRDLRARGVDARFLEGGVAAWHAAGEPTFRADAVSGLPGDSPSRWVTRERPKIDRIACPWLVRRFIDPLARFLYVPADQVIARAEAEHAIAFDVPQVRFSHRGERCTFDAMLEDFDLHEAALDALATIVRGADTARPELAPQSPGLLAVSLGLSALYPDDHEMLAEGLVVYDALYAWLRAAREETHNANLFRQ
ncbi:MAG: chromate resistance protein [Betaproteobacteria bacterium]|jgi:rhodanese-related sulfurtransferase|nr:chromate resistance protein [Betaproteobacteria bacterium]